MKLACALLILLVGTSGCFELKEISAAPELPPEAYLPTTKYTEKSGSLDFKGVNAPYVELRWQRHSSLGCAGKDDVVLHLVLEDVYLYSGVCAQGTCSKKMHLSKPVYAADVEVVCPSKVWVTVSLE